ncbi:hypothetical protein [Penaeicola halotolerans]|uniref:hypothetical protein n=1 Tax=Penaeicola halotolerans TaxID=2793196 RepID=UPI001CF874F0|nr:hypothetical protein [Penaeicola halotolerans]
MKKYLLITLFFISSYSVFGQHYDIGVHGGMFTPIDFWFYERGEVGLSGGIKFNYHFNDKLSISSNYFYGDFHYVPQSTNLRSKVTFNVVSFLVFRKFNLKNDWKIHFGTGFGYYLEHQVGERNSLSGLKEYDRDLTMPIEINLNKELYQNVVLGIKTGVFLSPFYWFGGFHIGPEISYRF